MLARNNQVEGILPGELEGIAIVLCAVNGPFVVVEKISEELIHFRPGIDNERVMVLDGEGTGRELAAISPPGSPFPAAEGEKL